jgi:CRISPR/Cas system-associated exonuclease Cas4 (RecB family)
MSRFLQQMKYEPSSGAELLNLRFEIKNPVTISERIERTPDHNRKLQIRFPSGNISKPLSPSAINTWLSCRMKFYYQYVNGLSEPKKVITEIDPALLGSMVHAAIKRLYSGYIGKTLDSLTIKGFIENRTGLEELIRISLNEVLRRENESFPAINEMMVKEVLYNYVSRILEIDRFSAPFTIMSIEKPYSFRFVFETGSGRHDIIAGGKIDRVDIKDGVTRIVDYKTGKTSDTVVSIIDLFKDDRDKEPDAWLQTLLYCEAYLGEVSGARTRPSVYKIKKTPGEDVTDKLILGGTVIEDYSAIRQEFIDNLGLVIRNIFSSNEPFIMTKMTGKKCNYCPFRVLCCR